jgi:hypothetical protein
MTRHVLFYVFMICSSIHFGVHKTSKGHALAYWLRYDATHRKVAFSISDEKISSIYLILPAALGPGVYPAITRNGYQKHKNNNVSGG